MEETKTRIRRRFILFQLLAFGSFAPMNYYNIYLKSIGFDSTRIGIFGSVGSIIAMTTLPIWGIVSDKIGSPKKMYIVSMVVFGVVFALFPTAGKMAETMIPLYALIVIYSLVKQPTHSLQDAWMVGTSRAYGINYSSIRMWGSFGFAVVAIFNGIITEYTGSASVFYITPMLVIPLIFLCLRSKDDEMTKGAVTATPKATKMKPWILFKNYYLVTAFIITVLLGCYGAFITPFYPYILEHAGVSPDRYGLISGYGAFVQVFVMMFLTKFCKNVPLYTQLIVAGLFSIVESIMYAVASNIWMMFAAGTFWGVAMAMNVSILPSYIVSLVPRGYTATAMSLNGSIAMMLTIIGNFVGGYLVASLGIETYMYGVAVLKLSLAVLFALSLLIGKKVLRITHYDPALETKN